MHKVAKVVTWNICHTPANFIRIIYCDLVSYQTYVKGEIILNNVYGCMRIGVYCKGVLTFKIF